MYLRSRCEPISSRLPVKAFVYVAITVRMILILINNKKTVDTEIKLWFKLGLIRNSVKWSWTSNSARLWSQARCSLGLRFTGEINGNEREIGCRASCFIVYEYLFRWVCFQFFCDLSKQLWFRYKTHHVFSPK